MEINDSLIDAVLLNVKEDLFGDDFEVDVIEDTVLMRLIFKSISLFIATYNTEPPESLLFVIEEDVIKRYNRRHNEGFASMSEDGYSVSFDLKDVGFLKYDTLIRRHLKLEPDRKRYGGTVRFL